MKRQTQMILTSVNLVAVVILVLLVLGLNSRVGEMRQLSAEATRLADQQAALLYTKAVLATQIIEATSDAQVKQWAYEDAKMVPDGEGNQLVIPLVDEQATPELPEPVEIRSQSVENWQIWLALLFEPDAP